MGWLSILSTALSLVNRLVRWAERRSLVRQGRAEMVRKWTIAHLRSKNATKDIIAKAVNMSDADLDASLDDSDFID